MREGSVILLEEAHGRIAYQLRDSRPDISYPDHWGLFGGLLEMGETPEQCIEREMVEELGLTLDTARLAFVKIHRDDFISHVFRYPAPLNLAGALLREGQRLEFLSLTQLKRRRAVPRHRSIVEWYEAQKGTA